MLGSPLDAQGQPMFRSGQAQPKPPQQQGTPYGQQFNYVDWLRQGRPESGQAAWQQAGSPKSRPQGGNYQAWSPQNIQPFTQTLNTPFGQMDPGQYYQQRDAFIQSANNQMGQYMPGQQMHGQAPQFNVGQMWGQAGDMVQQGWQNPFAQWQQPAAPPAQQQRAMQNYAAPPQSAQPQNYYGLGTQQAWEQAGSPKSMPPLMSGPTSQSFRPGQAQPIEPAFGGTLYGAPSPWGDVFQRPPPVPGYGADGYGGGAQPPQRPGFPDRDRDGIDDRQQSAPADFKQPEGITAAVMKRAPTGKTWAEYSSQFPAWAEHEAKQKAGQEAQQKRSQELAERVRDMNNRAAATYRARGIPYTPPAAPGSPPGQPSPPRFSDYYRGDGSYDYASATAAGRAYQQARTNSPENQAWLRRQTPDNRRVYRLMQGLY